jgi:prepilin-type N-terminal cleavage/methylation domain-containing protein
MPMKRSATTGGRRGFTLVEVLISLSVLSVLLLALHRLAVSSERSQEIGTRITHANQNLRSALEIVSRDLRMAGSGFAGIPVQTANGACREVVFPITPGYTFSDDADSVTVLAGLDDSATHLSGPMATPSSDIDCKSVAGFSPGDLVVVTDGTLADMFEVTAVVHQGATAGKLLHDPSKPRNVSSGHSQWPGGGYPSGSRVTKVSRVTLQAVDEHGALKLMRRVNGDSPVPLIQNLKAVTFSYRLPDGTETRNPPSPADIQEIIVNIEAGLRSGWGLEDRSVTTSTSVRPRSA